MREVRSLQEKKTAVFFPIVCEEHAFALPEFLAHVKRRRVPSGLFFFFHKLLKSPPVASTGHGKPFLLSQWFLPPQTVFIVSP